MDRKGIACGGNWIIDNVKTIDFWPAQDTLANILADENGTGGSAYNVLVDLARFQLDIPLTGVGLVGDDARGDMILEDCEDRGIDTQFIRRVDDVPTAYTDVMAVEETGRRTFFHNRGANALFAPEHVPVEDLTCKVFNLGYLLLLDTMDEEDGEFGTRAARILSHLHSVGISTSIDVVSEDSDRFAEIVTPALEFTDFCIINEIEASRTTGIEISKDGKLDADAMEAAARELLNRGVRKLAVIHTPEVSLGVSTDGEVCRRPTHELPDDFVVGVVGAGDAFLAGMLVAIHEEWKLEDSLAFANAAAATCLRHPTTTGGVGSAAEIRKLAAEMPLRAL